MYASEPDLNMGDTTAYAHKLGKPAVLVECGQHNNPYAVKVGLRTIINSLVHLDMISQRYAQPVTEPEYIRGHQIIRVPKEGGKLIKNWQHLEPVSDKTVLAVSDTGEKIISPCEGLIILPKYDADPGKEWFYIGERIDNCANPGIVFKQTS